MTLACLIYIAKLNPNADQALFHQHKDTTTRQYASDKITGVLMIAGEYLFEIMEGQYATLESNLDRISSAGLMEEPEILLFTTLKEQQFQTWKMGVIESGTPASDDLEIFRKIGTPAQLSPEATPGAALGLLKQFHDQFATQAPSADAA